MLLGLLPWLYATGSGSEIQQPLVALVFGGLISSLILTLIILPVLYVLIHSGATKDFSLAQEENRHVPAMQM